MNTVFCSADLWLNLDEEVLSRRELLKTAAGAALVGACQRGFAFGRRHNDDALLNELSDRCFRFFQNAMDRETGCRNLIRGDPQDNAGKGDESRGSTGVTGFCLTAMCIGAERKWIPRQDAKDRVRRALRSYTNSKVECVHGWFYHFLDVHTGRRRRNSEVSTSDSIWLLAGALTSRQYFHEGSEIKELAALLYSRYDFVWMTNLDGKLLAHGWRPEGFIKFRYDKYCQLIAMYLLGIGSPTHALPPEAWYALGTQSKQLWPVHYIGTSLLWTHQYPLAWFDLRGQREQLAAIVRA